VYRRHPIILGGASCVFFAGQSGQPPRPSDQKEASVTTQALFIGLDAADKDLLLEWAHAGHLPHIRALLSRAAWGVTRNPLGLFVGAVWPSFYTGVSPARHGRYCYTQLQPGTYRSRRFAPAEVGHEPFWNPLSRAGRRVAVIDVPKSSPSPDLNGVQIVDWGTHDPDCGYSSTPEGLAGELETRFARTPHKCDHLVRDHGPRELRDQLIARIETKERLSAHLLDQGHWDLFLTVFSESHCAGHQFWHLHDTANPHHDASLARSLGNPLQDVYTALDAAVGRLLARVGPSTHVYLLASHGMGPHFDATFLLRDMLRALEDASVSAPRRWAGKLVRRAWSLAPKRARAGLAPLRKHLEEPMTQALPSLDLYSSRKCFAVLNNDVYGAIRINQVGREPNGRVHPGAEFEAYAEQLARDLSDFKIVPSGQPLVRRVIRTSEHYRGDRLHALPDLLVEWNREAPISSIRSRKTGTISGQFRGSRTGDHKPEGLILAAGPAIRPGPVDGPIDVMDMAPTVAALLGVALPEVDGRVVKDLLPMGAGR
jgi:predicted AlkP superfamily phosphohydrolase/phosphomutase